MSLTTFFAMQPRSFAFRRLAYWSLVALWTTTMFVSPFVRAQETREALLAAKPFVSTNIEGMAATTGKDGTPYAVSMQQGINAPLQIINLKTMQRVVSAEQRSDGKLASGRAYVTLPNRHVLVGTTAGYAYIVNLDTLSATEQAPQVSSRVAFQRAVMGDENIVYLTASSNSEQRLFTYNYQTSVWRNLGTVPDAEAGLGYTNKKVYLGNKTGVSLLAWDTAANRQSVLGLDGLPAETSGLRVLGAHGGYVYVNTIGKTPLTLVYDTVAGKVIDQKPAFSDLVLPYGYEKIAQQPVAAAPQATTPQSTASPAAQSPNANTETNPNPETPGTQTPNDPTQSQEQRNRNTTTPNPDPSQSQQTTPNGETQTQATQTPSQPQPQTAQVVKQPQDAPVYFGALSRYSPLEKTVSVLANTSGLRAADGSCWLDTSRCVVYSPEGKLGILQSGGRTLKLTTPSPLVGGFQPARAVVAHGTNVFAAGEGPGSPVLHADLVRKSRSKVVAPPSGGVTGLAVVGSTVFAGSTTGEITYYETTKQTTTPRFEKPLRVGDGSVTAMVASGENVAFAVNQKGKSAGLVGVYTPANGKTKISAQPVLLDQEIASLAAKGSTIYGGGSGQNAVLFAYDTARQTVVGRSVPVAGAKTISSVVLGDDGYLYGVADETLFQADAKTLVVTRTKQFYATGQPGTVAFSGGKLGASVGGKIYNAQIDDFSVTEITTGTHLAVTGRGDFIYSREGALYRMAAETDEVVAGATTTNSGGFHLADVQMQLGAGSAAVLVLLLVIPIVRLFTHRPTYSIRR